jgi:hypothetical protein
MSRPVGSATNCGIERDVGGAVVGEDFLGSARGVLLVGDEGEEDVTAVRTLVDAGGGDHEGGDAGFHVVTAPAVQAALDDRVERVAVVARQADGVEMAVEHDRPPATSAGSGAEDRRAFRPAFRACHDNRVSHGWTKIGST